jgi:hypothetical protein
MTLESVIANTWIDDILSGDSTLTGLATGGVYHAVGVEQDGVTVLPDSARYPLVIFRFLGGSYGRTMDGRRINGNLLYAIYGVIDDESLEVLEPIAQQVDALLDNKSGTVTNGRVDACWAELPIQAALTQNDIAYRTLGNTYRLIVSRQGV